MKSLLRSLAVITTLAVPLAHATAKTDYGVLRSSARSSSFLTHRSGERTAQSRRQRRHNGDNIFTIPRHITILFILESDPSLNAQDSLWEVHYQLRVGDQKSYSQWNSPAESRAKQHEPGDLLKEDSFTRNHLSHETNRRVVVAVTVETKLLEHFQRLGQQLGNMPQVLWLDASARIRARTTSQNKKDDIEIINNDVNPSWDLRSFIKESGQVTMGISPKQNLRWSTKVPPPWRGGSTTVTKRQPL